MYHFGPLSDRGWFCIHVCRMGFCRMVSKRAPRPPLKFWTEMELRKTICVTPLRPRTILVRLKMGHTELTPN